MPTEPRTRSLTIEAGFHHHTAEVSIRGKLDTASATLLAEMLDLVLDRQPRNLVLDMAGVNACDGAAVSVITRVVQTLHPFGRVVIQHPGLATRRLLDAAGLAATDEPKLASCPDPVSGQDELTGRKAQLGRSPMAPGTPGAA